MKPRLLAAIFGTALQCVAPFAAAAAAPRPNIVVILADDLGFSDIGCYGGEIRTPNLDALAAQGVRFTQFYNVARCCPSRASLLTGLYPHQAGVGDMVDEYARKVRETLDSPAYSDRMDPRSPTIAEALRAAGYRTGMSGKWHLGYRPAEWPAARGFHRSFAVIEGAMNYYGFGIQHTGATANPPMALGHETFIPPREGFFATDAFTDYAVRFIRESADDDKPFFLYLAYNAPHWPLHARPETIATYRGQYRKIGWDALRQQRYERLTRDGIIDPAWKLAPRPDQLVPWEQASPRQQDRWDKDMSVYAAQVTEMDHGIGRVLQTLRESGREADTVVLFLSDNGGAVENPARSLPGATLGARDSYAAYGLPGAHVSSGPFRKNKVFTHEGGISAPMIVRWPAGIGGASHGQIVRQTGHLIDILPTCLELAGATFPRTSAGHATTPPEGVSLLPAVRGKPLDRHEPLFWEHEGHRAVRDGKWKLVASFNEPWELYDMEADRTELNDLVKSRPDIAARLAARYEAWAHRVGVKPWPVLPKAATAPAKPSAR